jgi:hypothetical protein
LTRSRKVRIGEAPGYRSATRRVTEVSVTDLGDRLVVTPVPSRDSLRGKYKDALPPTEKLRADERRVRERA